MNAVRVRARLRAKAVAALTGAVLVGAGALAPSAGATPVAPTPTPTATPTASPTPTAPTPTGTATPTPEPGTPTPKPTPTADKPPAPTDPATAADAATAIEARYQELGGSTGILGVATSAVTAITGGYVRRFENGSIYYSASTGAWDVRTGPMQNYYDFLGAQESKLGFPTGAQYTGALAGVLIQRFTGGRIYYSAATGARGVYGPLLARYLALGGEAGKLGLPTNGEGSAQPTGARLSAFEHGRIYWSSTTGAWDLTGVMLDYYVKLGGSASPLGLPTSAAYSAAGGVTVQNFVKGRVYHSSTTGAQGVYGATLDRYLQLGGSGGVLGPPTVAERAGKKAGSRVTVFKNGRIWYSSKTGAREVRGVTLARYLSIGAEASRIGLPNTYHKQTSYGDWQGFEYAVMKYYSSTKKAYVRMAFTVTSKTPTAADIPYTYRSGCPVGPSSLRMLKVVFRNFYNDDQYGTIVVRSTVVDDITAMYRAAYDHGWPFRRVNPVDVYQGDDIKAMAADNTSAFNCRKVTGNPYKLSQHSYGNAIDINTYENPYVTASNVYPEGSDTYLNRGNKRKGMILRGDPVESTLRGRGWPWGARWSYPDYQHFSENGG
ncbi:M15 family metallopeptidase [Actinopolymorpha singaporensis]